jgi:hypothetical protein
VDTREKKKKRTSKKNVDERCTSSHEHKTFRSRSVVKQKRTVFGFRKTATAVTRPERQKYRIQVNFGLQNVKVHFHVVLSPLRIAFPSECCKVAVMVCVMFMWLRCLGLSHRWCEDTALWDVIHVEW